jgi:hypothetical protein
MKFESLSIYNLKYIYICLIYSIFKKNISKSIIKIVKISVVKYPSTIDISCTDSKKKLGRIWLNSLNDKLYLRKVISDNIYSN